MITKDLEIGKKPSYSTSTTLTTYKILISLRTLLRSCIQSNNVLNSVYFCVYAMAAVRSSSIVNKRPWKALPFTIKLHRKHRNSAKVQLVLHLFTGISWRLLLRFGQCLKGKAWLKKKNIFLFQFSWATKVPKGVCVFAASFWCKIWTKRWWYFLIVALYYCKMGS